MSKKQSKADKGHKCGDVKSERREKAQQRMLDGSVRRALLLNPSAITHDTRVICVCVCLHAISSLHALSKYESNATVHTHKHTHVHTRLPQALILLKKKKAEENVKAIQKPKC